MPYGTPTSNTGSATYQIIFSHDNGTSFNLTRPVTPGGLEADKDEATQALLDLLAADADWTVTFAEKAYPTTEEITVTP